MRGKPARITHRGIGRPGLLLGAMLTVAGGLVAGCATGGGAPTLETASVEKDLSCRKLTGRMQVRILQIRDRRSRAGTTGLSQSLQSVGYSIFGGTPYGQDMEAQHRADVAQLEAMNAKLASKYCKTFDLAKELRPRDVRHTPRPQ